ncbi:MAG: sulfatase-like hydrolase/transferase [Bacteroidales bacterium]|nr:sulfatase-like hydrolase/transferase [Bacteroidales bacterium]
MKKVSLLLGLSLFVSGLIYAQKPNIILIMSDDQGWGDAGYQGHPELKTPNLDDMAANGLVFNRFYAAAPVCSPTRGSVLTGRHPYRYGIYNANTGHLKKEEKLLPEVLRQNGYTTGHFGKWHLGTMNKFVLESNRGGLHNTEHYSPPWENGYDVCFATESRVPTWDPMVNPPLNVGGANKDQKAGNSFGTYYWTADGCFATENLQGDDSRVIMDRAIPFIQENVKHKKPFFATVWFHTPHSPVVAGGKYLEMYKDFSEDKQHYYGTLTAMDEQIGRLRQELRRLGVAENTMIWFCSDNGPAAKGGGPGWDAGDRQQGVTGGFRGRKGSLFEGGVRVPGILEWPARIKSASKTDLPAVTSDYFPTILDILNIKVEKQPVLDGKSLKNLIEGQDIIKRNQPIGFRFRFEGQEWQVWNDDQYKLIYKVKDKEYLLFDLYSDPYEKNNIIAKEFKIASKLKLALEEWVKSTEMMK